MEAAVEAAGYTSWLLHAGLVLLWGWIAMRNFTRYLSKTSTPFTGALKATMATIPALLFAVYVSIVPSLGLWATYPNLDFSVPSHAFTWPGAGFLGLTVMYFLFATTRRYLNTPGHDYFTDRNAHPVITSQKGKTV